MSTIVTYDISDGHTEVKTQCLVLGFEDCLKIKDGPWKRLPNTTLRHPKDDQTVVLGEFRKAVAIAAQKINRPITIEKIYLVPQGASTLVSDQDCNGPKSR